MNNCLCGFHQFKYNESMSHTQLATQIVRKLQDAGFVAYFAGGWVRDYFMGNPSDDVDIATSATPQEIIGLFKQTLLVGISFGVVIVVLEGQQFEVSSFRKDFEYLDGRKPSRIELSGPREDAQRRDFTINGMFYDPINHEIFDYVQGVEDIKNRIIRTIGNPDERFLEDRLRMIRAIRFSAKFDFKIDAETHQAIIDYADSLFPAVAKERVWQELLKMAASDRFDFAIIELHRAGLLGEIFPPLKTEHLHDIKERIKCFKNIPKGVPAIVFLNQLFTPFTPDKRKELFQELRVSNADLKWVEFQSKAECAGDDLVEWAYVYAHPLWPQMEKILQAIKNQEEAQKLLDLHSSRMLRLASAIKRIQHKQPVVNSARLMQEGILPGVKMGRLLKLAERVSIEQKVEDPEALISILRTTPEWKG